MPFMLMKTNLSLNNAQQTALQTAFGQAISLLAGKSEQSLLLGIESGATLYLRGKKQEPIVYIELSVYAHSHHQGYAEFSRAVSLILMKQLGVPPQNVYLQYRDIQAWSVGDYYVDEKNGA